MCPESSGWRASDGESRRTQAAWELFLGIAASVSSADDCNGVNQPNGKKYKRSFERRDRRSRRHPSFVPHSCTLVCRYAEGLQSIAAALQLSYQLSFLLRAVPDHSVQEKRSMLCPSSWGFTTRSRANSVTKNLHELNRVLESNLVSPESSRRQKFFRDYPTQLYSLRDKVPRGIPASFRPSISTRRTRMSIRRIVCSVLALIVPMLLVGCGGSSTPPSMPPATSASRFALVSNLLANSISTYAIDSQTGRLTAKDTVSTGGMNSRVIAVAPSGRFAYVANVVSNDISVFSIDAHTGGLALVASPVPAGSGPRFIVLGPGGNVLYVVNQDSDHITGFSINTGSGALTPLSGSVTTDDAPVELRFHPSGHFAYVANFNSGDITVYRVDGSGALALLGATPVGLSLSSIGMHPSGKFAYVTSLASNQITTLSIDQSSGGLTPLMPPVATGDGPNSIAVESQGRFVYVTNAIEGTVTAFAIDDATGALTRRSTVPAGTIPISLTLDPSGRFAFVANQGSDNVTSFTVDSITGALTPTGPPVNAGTGPTWVALVK